MKLKKGITVGAVVCLLLGNVMHVSAAGLYPGDYANVLVKNQQDGLIIDVEAYKAAYDDLAKAFGDDSYAYVNHYLTVGVYEGRTKGVLFDPLLYVESYGDVKAAFGYDISAIVDHYIKYGIKEKRTLGTAQGYSDIAAAEKAGVQSTKIPRNVNNTTGAVADSGYINNSSTAVYNDFDQNSALANNSMTPAGGFMNVDSVDGISDSSMQSNNVSMANNSASTGSNSVAAYENNSPVSIPKDYHHTTSIYDNDEKTLLRVEYYDDNNQLIKYSSVTNFDSDTNSYTENIYHYDEETSSSVLERTDVYEGGELSSSEAQ